MSQPDIRFPRSYADDVDTPDRLRSIRRRARLTQTELAERLGVAQSWVSDRERGIRKCSVDELMDWAEACDVQVAVLTVPSVGDLGEALSAAPPADLALVLELLQTLPDASAETRASLQAILSVVRERARARVLSTGA